MSSKPRKKDTSILLEFDLGPFKLSADLADLMKPLGLTPDQLANLVNGQPTPPPAPPVQPPTAAPGPRRTRRRKANKGERVALLQALEDEVAAELKRQKR